MTKSEYNRNFLRQAEEISSALNLDAKHEHNFIKATLKVAGNIYDSNLIDYVSSFTPNVEKNVGVVLCGVPGKKAVFQINIYSNQPNVCRTQIGNSEKPRHVSPKQAVERLSKYINKTIGLYEQRAD